MTTDPLLPHLMPPFCVILRERRRAILTEAYHRAAYQVGAQAAPGAAAAEYDTTEDEIEGLLADVARQAENP